MYLFALVLHVLINFLLGYGILNAVFKGKFLPRNIFSITLVGIFLETSGLNHKFVTIRIMQSSSFVKPFKFPF